MSLCFRCDGKVLLFTFLSFWQAVNLIWFTVRTLFPWFYDLPFQLFSCISVPLVIKNISREVKKWFNFQLKYFLYQNTDGLNGSSTRLQFET